jgi:hypothetical protein
MLDLQTDSQVIVGFVPLDQQATAEPGSLFSCVEKRPINQAEFATAYTEGSLQMCVDVAKDERVTFQPTSDGEDLKRSLMFGRSNGHMLDLRICGLLDTFLKNGIHPLDISSLAGQHHADGSLHYSGRAIDFGNETLAPELLRWVAANQKNLQQLELMPKRIITSPELKKKYKTARWVSGRADHRTHFHIEF